MVVASTLGRHPAVALLLPTLRKPSSCPFGLSRSLRFAPRSRKFSTIVAAASMESPPPGYRRNVGICLINSDNKIFSASRLDIPGRWQMPQGGVDEEEDPQIAAFRELKEETGVTSADILAEVPHWLTYDFPPQVREKLNKQWGTDWKGQAQKWFLFRFTGKEDEINLAGDGTEKPEFAEWAWMRPTQVIELAVDFKKPVYEEALKISALFSKLLANLRIHCGNSRFLRATKNRNETNLTAKHQSAGKFSNPFAPRPSGTGQHDINFGNKIERFFSLKRELAVQNKQKKLIFAKLLEQRIKKSKRIPHWEGKKGHKPRGNERVVTKSFKILGEN